MQHGGRSWVADAGPRHMLWTYVATVLLMIVAHSIIAVEAEKYAPSLELAFRLARAFRAPFETVFHYEE
jgi:hypothetical protein